MRILQVARTQLLSLHPEQRTAETSCQTCEPSEKHWHRKLEGVVPLLQTLDCVELETELSSPIIIFDIVYLCTSVSSTDEGAISHA